MTQKATVTSGSFFITDLPVPEVAFAPAASPSAMMLDRLTIDHSRLIFRQGASSPRQELAPSEKYPTIRSDQFNWPGPLQPESILKAGRPPAN
ncbi:hypothetical protein ACFV3F_21275 [Streptomyces sp. NPDC059717]|uniref:hypothetical protein n=1 Tax=Streptomyces sp. NPDC059717 TaxID=3346922 RepID=UPI0036B13DFD